MLRESYPFYLANRAEMPNTDLEVIDKYSGEVATRVAMASAEDIDRAIAAAEAAAEPMARLASYERKAVLEHCVKRFRERFDELAEALCIEAGSIRRTLGHSHTVLLQNSRILLELLLRRRYETNFHGLIRRNYSSVLCFCYEVLPGSFMVDVLQRDIR